MIKGVMMKDQSKILPMNVKPKEGDEIVLPMNVKLKEGEKIGNYEIIEKVGEGGYAIVYKVKDKDNNIKALKFLKGWEYEPAVRDDFYKRFKNEFNIAKQCNSQYINTAYELEIFDGNYYYTQDYQLTNLAELIKNDNAWILKCRNKETVLEKILLGLKELHDKKIIHRDLKPENILITDEYEVKIADFGISANLNNRLTVPNLKLLGITFKVRTKYILGTELYLPFELTNLLNYYEGTQTTADIFSFGVLAYYLITKCFPFGEIKLEYNESEKEKMNKDISKYRMNRADGKILKIEEDIPEHWKSIIYKCLEKDPKKRYQNVNQILMEINQMNSNKTKEPLFNFNLKVIDGEEQDRIYDIGYGLFKPLMEMRDDEIIHLIKTKRILTLGVTFHEGIGIAPENDIKILENKTEFISNYHCTFMYSGKNQSWFVKDGQYRMKDDKLDWYPSSNGTYVNGELIEDKWEDVCPGDIIKVGETKLKVIAYGSIKDQKINNLRRT